MTNELKQKYFTGEDIPAREFNNKGGLSFYGNTVYEDWRRDKVTAQFDLEGELHYKKVSPITEMKPGEAYLTRPTDVTRRQIFTETKSKCNGWMTEEEATSYALAKVELRSMGK